MALQLRPNCEYCDKDLPPASTEARICSYECTFCADCAENKLGNVCPNCGGGFVPRPIRPAKEWRPGLSVAKRPPSDKRVHLSYSLDDIAQHSTRIFRPRIAELPSRHSGAMRSIEPGISRFRVHRCAMPRNDRERIDEAAHRLFGSNRFSSPFQHSA